MSGGALLPGLLVAAVLLVLAGLAKLRQPAVAAGFLGSFGLPAPLALVYAAGLLEISAGGAVPFWPRPAAAAMALLYLVFAVLIAAQLRRPASVPCGCLGAATIPPSRVHLWLNLVCLAVAAVAVVAPPAAYPSVAASDPLAAALAGLVAVVAALLAAAAVTLFPVTMAAWRGAEA